MYVYTDYLRGKVDSFGGGAVLPVIVRKNGHVVSEIQLFDSAMGKAHLTGNKGKEIIYR